MLLIGVDGAHAAVRSQYVLTVGMVGAVAKFVFFDETWDKLGKTAVFRQGNVTKDAVIIDGTVTIPWEVLQLPGIPVSVGVYGTNGDGTIVIPTVWTRTAPVQPGADPSGDESYPPTPAVGEQAVAVASKALQAAAEAREVAADIQRRADAGEFDGAPGYTPVKGEDYFDGNDYVLTEADKVEIAEIAADLVDVPESGGSADLTGYATEEWVEKGYQPKGDYATKDEIPPVPTKLSAFTNDAGFVTEDALENVGGKAYVQDTEPAQMEVGEFWYKPEEEADSFPTTLPNPHKLTFSGAVSAEYDGSEAVEVVIPHGGGGSSGGEEWELINSVVTTEEVKSMIFDADSNGNPFSLKKALFVEYLAPYGEGTAPGGNYMFSKRNGSISTQLYTEAPVADETKWVSLRWLVEATDDFVREQWGVSSRASADFVGKSNENVSMATNTGVGIKVLGYTQSIGVYNRPIPVGSIFQLYGVRA